MQLGDCPRPPEELNVFCETCRFNFFTLEGNPPCKEPLDCAHRPSASRNLENLRTWEGRPLLILGSRSRDPSGL